MKPAAKLHDQANVVCLPILSLLAVGGLLGWCDPVSTTTVAFLLYIVADIVWIAAIPDAVPSLPSLILFHHAVTLTLLCIPLRHPELGRFTCWDGLVEVNTLFLILRRQFKTGRAVNSCLYWATFFPLRMVLFPALLWQFYKSMLPYPLWEQVLVCCCQSILVGFNVMLLWLSIMNWRGSKRRSSSLKSSATRTGPLAGADIKPGAAQHMVHLRAKLVQ